MRIIANFNIKAVPIILLLLTGGFMSYGQGIVRGKVTDENGESVIGAALILKDNPSTGVVTDLDGNYSFKINDSVQHVLRVTYVGFNPVEVQVLLKGGQVLVKNFKLTSSFTEMKEVQITAKAERDKDYFVESMKRNSTTTLDYISSETMKKTGDNNVVAAVARVPGVSTNSNGFITVRGIGDRYVRTTINGSAIPTLDPFTNNIRLDLIPSSLVDNIIITKTHSPDLAGNWAGAYISVETKDYPEQLSISAETSIGYNSQSTFNEIISSERSSTDWLGFDDGMRDFDHKSFVYADIAPSTYRELIANGLGPFYNAMGVNQGNWGEGTDVGETYFKLGLVELGLLAPALFDDPNAVNQAKQTYESGAYSNNAFRSLNANVPMTGNAFSNNWEPEDRIAPLNFSQTFSIGNQVSLAGKPFGYIAGFRYGSTWQYDPSSEINRAAVALDGDGNLVDRVSSAMTQQTGREINGWSILLKGAYKLNANNNVSIAFMPNIMGTNNVRNSVDVAEPANYVITKSQFYEQRRQLIYQLKSDHYMPKYKSRIEFAASYTDADSKAPDFKNLQYFKDPITNNYQIGGAIGDGIHRYYRELSENLFDSRISIEFPLSNIPGMPRKIKFGGAYQYNDRLSDQYDYYISYGPYNKVVMTSDDLERYFDLSHFNMYQATDQYGVIHETIDMYYNQNATPANNTFGNSSIYSGFIMTDYALNSLLRVSGGLRIEKAVINTDVVEYDEKGYPKDDTRRNYSSGFPLANPGYLNETSFLPSISIIYKLRPDDDSPMNMRMNYSRSVARPSIRELSDVAIFDYEYRSNVYGNSELKIVDVNNYDLRWESYFKTGDNVSVSLFYKDFRNHIELVRAVGFSWQNVDKSTVAGVELEGRKKLSRRFEIRANLTLIESKTEFVRQSYTISNGVKVSYPLDTVKRPMFGQSPYVFNGMVTYSSDSIGLDLSISYNVQGPRLVIAADVPEIPDVYELPRHMIDLKATKKIGSHFNVSFLIRDLLNTPIRRSYNYDEGWTLDFDRYLNGTTYQLSVAYKF